MRKGSLGAHTSLADVSVLSYVNGLPAYDPQQIQICGTREAIKPPHVIILVLLRFR
jgi:hypothetical protein